MLCKAKILALTAFFFILFHCDLDISHTDQKFYIINTGQIFQSCLLAPLTFSWLSALVGCLSTAFIRKIIYKFINVYHFDYTSVDVSGKVGIP